MVRTPVFVRGTVIALAMCFASAQSLAAKPAAPPASIEERVDNLEPGHWVWRPKLAPEGEIEIVVSLPLQRAYVYRGGVLIGITTVSTGRAGNETPVGTFNILQKRREHYSNLYDNAPMPFMQRLTWDGVALHSGQIPGYPASHGCVRLPDGFARRLFEATSVGASVHVVDSAPSAEEALTIARSGYGAGIELASGGD